MFVLFRSFGLQRRLPWWQTGLLALIALPFLVLLLPLALFAFYRIRKHMKRVEKQFEDFEKAQRNSIRSPKKVQVEVMDQPVIDLSKEDFRSRPASKD